MTYNRTTWQKGDIVTADRLNNIESGLLRVATAVEVAPAGSSSNSNDVMASTAYVRSQFTNLNVSANNGVNETITELRQQNGRITSIIARPISINCSQISDIGTVLSHKADLESPRFTGAPVFTGNTNFTAGVSFSGTIPLYQGSRAIEYNNQLVTKSYVDNAIADAQVAAGGGSNNNISASLTAVNMSGNPETLVPDITLAYNTLYSLQIGNRQIKFTTPSYLTGDLSELTNEHGFVTADQVPSRTSQLTNDSGFITSTSIPNVPTRTSQLTNDSGFITSTSLPTVPTKTSDLTNDSGFITSTDLTGKANSADPTFTGTLTLGTTQITETDLQDLLALLGGGNNG